MQPIRSACVDPPMDAVLVTEEPLVAGLICAPTQAVIDLPSLSWLTLARTAAGRPVFLLQRARFAPMLADRYPRAEDALQGFEQLPVASYGDGGRLVPLRPRDTGRARRR